MKLFKTFLPSASSSASRKLQLRCILIGIPLILIQSLLSMYVKLESFTQDIVVSMDQQQRNVFAPNHGQEPNHVPRRKLEPSVGTSKVLKQVEAIRKQGQQEQKKHNKQQTKHQKKQDDDTKKTNTKNAVASKFHEHKDGIDNSSNFAYPGILNCDKYGGPSAEIAQEMVYWKDIPYDKTIISSPLRHQQEEQYITFEIDEGGWNNVRMGFETVVAIAIATGRTLVLPPRQQIWGVVDSSREHHLGFDDFFPLLLSQTKSLKVISFNEFIANVVMTGQFIDPNTGKSSFPPDNNRTNWDDLIRNYDSVREGYGKTLYTWLRNVAAPLKWNTDTCVAAFPSQRGPTGVTKLQAAVQHILSAEEKKNVDWRHRVHSYRNHPTPVNATMINRLREMLTDRRELCAYNETLQNAKVIHAFGEQDSGYRMLIHYYAFVFVEDYQLDLHIKRFIRDRLRYNDQLQCAAARIVYRVRQNAIENGQMDGGTFDSFHIRRNDFEAIYKDVFLPINDIYTNNTSKMIREKRTVYIATDERDLSFFMPLREHYNLLFMNDYMNEIKDILPNFFGLVDEIVAARGDTFVGTFYSTFSGYINRLRGYFAETYGIINGTIDSYYNAPDSLWSYRNIMRTYTAVEPQYWIREFPTCWRDIDHGLIFVNKNDTVTA